MKTLIPGESYPNMAEWIHSIADPSSNIITSPADGASSHQEAQ